MTRLVSFSFFLVTVLPGNEQATSTFFTIFLPLCIKSHIYHKQHILHTTGPFEALRPIRATLSFSIIIFRRVDGEAGGRGQGAAEEEEEEEERERELRRQRALARARQEEEDVQAREEEDEEEVRCLRWFLLRSIMTLSRRKVSFHLRIFLLCIIRRHTCSSAMAFHPYPLEVLVRIYVHRRNFFSFFFSMRIHMGHPDAVHYG